MILGPSALIRPGVPRALVHARPRAKVRSYTLGTPIKLDDFATDNFTLVGAGAAKALDNGTMLVTGPGSNVTTGLDKTYGSVDPTQLGVLAYYVDRVTDASVSSFTLALHRGATTSNVTFSNEAQFLKGGRWLAADISQWPTVQAAGVGALRTRELMAMAAPWSAQVRYDNLYTNAKGRPTVVLTFDDGYSTILNTALPLLQARGFKGTHYVAPGLLNTGGKMVTADLATLYAAGWDLGCDSYSDTAFTAAADTPAALADIQSVQSFLSGLGYTRGINHGCWPNGSKSQAIADAFRGAGILSMRNTEPQNAFTRFGVPPGVAMSMPSQGYTTATFAASWAARMAECKRDGTTQFFHFHADIADNGAAVFTAFVDSLKADYDANLVDVLTVSEWWARDGAASPP
jgi:hypothetical protein